MIEFTDDYIEENYINKNKNKILEFQVDHFVCINIGI